MTATALTPDPGLDRKKNEIEGTPVTEIAGIVIVTTVEIEIATETAIVTGIEIGIETGIGTGGGAVKAEIDTGTGATDPGAETGVVEVKLRGIEIEIDMGEIETVIARGALAKKQTQLLRPTEI